MTDPVLRGFKAPVGSDEHPCQICYCDSEFGFSTECKHFYCRECIQGSVKAILETGQFPAYCPACRAESGKDVKHGRIDEGALSFLLKNEVIDKDTYFRFLKQSAEKDQKFFRCPAKCGNALKYKETRWIQAKDGMSVVRMPGKCPCGALVCMSCMLLVKGDPKDHKCPKGQDDNFKPDEKTLAMMMKLGKPCPLCGNFVEKNGGCNYMMCGTNTHGNLRDALKNGGCGHQFLWDSLKPASTYYNDITGKRVSGNVGDMRHLLKDKRYFP